MLTKEKRSRTKRNRRPTQIKAFLCSIWPTTSFRHQILKNFTKKRYFSGSVPFNPMVLCVTHRSSHKANKNIKWISSLDPPFRWESHDFLLRHTQSESLLSTKQLFAFQEAYWPLMYHQQPCVAFQTPTKMLWSTLSEIMVQKIRDGFYSATPQDIQESPKMEKQGIKNTLSSPRFWKHKGPLGM